MTALAHDLYDHLIWNPAYPETVHTGPDWKVDAKDTPRLNLLKEAVESLSPVLDEHPCLLCESPSMVISIFSPANSALYGAQWGGRKHFIYTLCSDHLGVPNFHGLVEEFIAADVLNELCDSGTEH